MLVSFTLILGEKLLVCFRKQDIHKHVYTSTKIILALYGPS